MRPNWDAYFIQLAYKAAERATCPRRHVGAVIVKGHHVLATGYNGAKPSKPHCDDVGCLMRDGGCKRTIHAEPNAISRATRLERSGATLYCTDFPCLSCATAISRSGISEVVYDRPYRLGDEAVMELFAYHGIVCRKYGTEEKLTDDSSKDFSQELQFIREGDLVKQSLLLSLQGKA